MDFFFQDQKTKGGNGGVFGFVIISAVGVGVAVGVWKLEIEMGEWEARELISCINITLHHIHTYTHTYITVSTGNWEGPGGVK